MQTLFAKPDQNATFKMIDANEKSISRSVNKMWKVILLVLVVISPSNVWAETYKKTYSKGNWALYRVDGMDLRGPNGQYERIDGLCLMAYTSPQASLKFAMAPAAAARHKALLREYVWVQIASEKWTFRERRASAGLSVEISSYTERRARYDGNVITFGVSNFKKSFGVFLMFAGVRKAIDVLDSRGNVIARFPANGFAEVRDKFFMCAGV